MLGPWMLSFVALLASRSSRVALYALYYLAIVVGLMALYGQTEIRAPEFVYQGF